MTLLVSTTVMLSECGRSTDPIPTLASRIDFAPIVTETAVDAHLVENREAVVAVRCRAAAESGTIEVVEVDLSAIGGADAEGLAPQGEGLWTWHGTVTPTGTGPRTITFQAQDAEGAIGTASLHVEVWQAGTVVVSSEYVAARPDGSPWRCVPDIYRLGSSSDLVQSTIIRGMWTYDFSGGATAVGIAPPDSSLLGSPRSISIRLRGSTQGHSLRLRMMSHLAVFDRVLGPVEGHGEHEFVVSPPPDDGWTCLSGENDGALHGPLRIAGLFLDAAGSSDVGQIELRDIRVLAESPADRTCVMVAERRESGGIPQFVATIRSMTPQPIRSRVICTIRDWAGDTVATAEQETLIDSARPSEVRVAVPTVPHLFLEAEFTVDAPGQVISAAYACSVAPTEPRRNRPPTDSAFGIGAYLYRCYPDSFEEMEQLAEVAEQIGANWTREEFSWSAIEPRRGEFQWSFYDEVVATSKRHGLHICGLLCYWSPWTKPYTPEGIEDYRRYVRAVVERYRNDVHHWEVWNEPNIFFWSGPRDMYRDLLQAAYETIRQADPTAQVVGFSTAGIDRDFITRVGDDGARFDILSVHPYRPTIADEPFLAELERLATLATDNTNAIRPVWITELGFSTNVPHNTMGAGGFAATPREQTQLLARAYIDALGSGRVTNLTWYDLRDDGENLLEPEHAMGIMTRRWQPKPALRAFATLTRLLEGRACERLTFAEDVIAFAFTRPADGDQVLAVWTKGPHTTKRLFPARGLRVLTDLMGQSHPLAETDGQVEFTLQPLTPVFLSAEADP